MSLHSRVTQFISLSRSFRKSLLSAIEDSSCAIIRFIENYLSTCSKTIFCLSSLVVSDSPPSVSVLLINRATDTACSPGQVSSRRYTERSPTAINSIYPHGSRSPSRLCLQALLTSNSRRSNRENKQNLLIS